MPAKVSPVGTFRGSFATSSVVLLGLPTLLLTCLVFTHDVDAQENELCYGKKATIEGTDGSDVLVGTDDQDVIVAGAGNDIVIALGGRDYVCAGPGGDVVVGGGGADAVQGEAGADLLAGLAGRDGLLGQEGNDRVLGGRGRDTLTGGSDLDYLDGGQGFDYGFGDGDECTLLQGLCELHCRHVLGLNIGADGADGEARLVSAQVSEELDYGFELAIITATGEAFPFVDRRPVLPGSSAADFPGAQAVGRVIIVGGKVVGCASASE